jgi:hypothetical protein
MKLLRVLLAIGMLIGMTLATIGCSMDFHNPSANEWDVQIVGDSVFDLSGDIQTVLKSKSGKTYKDRSVSGAKIAAIQSQLNTALGRTTLKTVIADGGANDILQGTADCNSDPVTPACKDVLNYVGDKMENMINVMYYKSPDDCVWLGYYHVKGDQAAKNEAIDWAYDWVYPGIFPGFLTDNKTYSYPVVYLGTEPNIYMALLVDSRPSFNNHPEYIKSDNIHPTYNGSVIWAGLIWDAMGRGDMYK